MTEQHIPEAVAQLRKHFASGLTRSDEWRDGQLSALSRMLSDNTALFETALQRDLGKSPVEGVLTELGFLLTEIDHTRAQLRRWMRPTRVRTALALQPASARIVAEPYGVVLVIAPWNYPLMLALSPVIGALSAGNTVVIKPSELAPHTSELLARIVPSYLDHRAVTVIEGAVEETTALLSEKFDYIFYTGNGTVGRIVMTAAAQHLTPVTLELGGKSPVYVDETTDLRQAAQRIAWGKFVNAGQTCVAPDYLLATEPVIQRLTPLLAEAVRSLYGTAAQKNPDYGRIVNTRHTERLAALIDDGTAVVGGGVDVEDLFIEPTVLTDVSRDSEVMAHEIFGPILPMIAVSDLDDAIGYVRSGDKPLALYVFSEDGGTRQRWTDETSSGALAFGVPMAHLMVPDLPFGGVGASGMGAYHGQRSFLTFSHEKAVLSKPLSPDTLRSTIMPPYTAGKETVIRRLLRRIS
ncbi:aldehyde dehydrogenase family protein [Klugiella xanthotipulae]|uniref:Aldehyde dehydrogenase n=1 Tax=Klugiella xanthotipulae TaxID=244735 RepID=A0A543I4A7_9MICO|nr:aldehyde dehydrogenase family protein [Klugiella xanthotipulae]TQM65429.1 aldehyde dehydrogenase (NAD+) [Klugiella xanthotipulae]